MGILNETYLSAQPAGAETPPRLSLTHGYRWRTESYQLPPGARPEAPLRLRRGGFVDRRTGQARLISPMQRRPEFLAAARALKAVRPCLLLQVRAHQDRPGIRYGLTASKKTGNAVHRNRARRRLRALAREHLPQMGRDGCDYVFIARASTADCAYGDLEAAFLSAAGQLHERLQKRAGA